MAFRALAVLALSGIVSAQAGLYAQCGGTGYSGSTECVAGAYCSKLSDYYSQCVPGVSTTAPSQVTSTNPPSPTSSASYIILAGGYSSAIAAYRFTPSAGTLSLISQSTTAMNPSWIALHPTNKKVLYATNENWQGGIQSFSVGADGSLSSASSTLSSGGADPAHLLPLSSGGVAVMNYDGGNGMIFGASSSNPLQLTSGPTITFNGSPSHPHQAYEYKGEIFVPDLGADTIWRLGNSGGSWSIAGQIPQPKKSGPRHMAISGNTLFVLHELSSTLSAQPLPSSPSGSSSPSSTISITPSDAPAGAVWAAAEIAIPPPSASFPTQYIYVSNRNTANSDPRGDALAIFAFDAAAGQLSLVRQVFTGLNQVRGFAFGGAESEYLVAGAAAGQGGVGVWRRTEGGKGLELVARNTQVATRTSFAWL